MLLCDFPSPSVNFPCVCGTFRQLSVQPLIFCQLSLRPHNLRQLPSSVNKLRPQNLLSTSVDFPCICRIYHKLASTFHVDGGTPVNFPSYWLIFRQLSLRPWDLSNSFHFPQLERLGSLIPACERQVCLADVSVRILCSNQSTSLNYSVVQAVQAFLTPNS